MLEVFRAASVYTRQNERSKIVIESARNIFGPERLYAESKKEEENVYLSWMIREQVKN